LSRKNNKNKNKNKPSWHEGIKPETKRSVFAILSFAIAVLLALAAFGKAGLVGNGIQKILEVLFGRAFFMISLVFFIGGISLLRRSVEPLRAHFLATTVVGAALLLLSTLGIADLIFQNKIAGYIGFVASYPFFKLFDFTASLIILVAIALAGIFIMFNMSFRREKLEEDEVDEEEPEADEKDRASILSKLDFSKTKVAPPEKIEEKPPEVKEPERAVTPVALKQEEFIHVPLRKAKRAGGFLMPPLDLLDSDSGTPSSGDIKANSNIIKRSFQNFGIEVEMTEVNVGPSVTQYTFKPAEGVKLSRITGLQNDLSLALAAHPIRIEAPIPGKSAVGIEIPNRSISLVGLRSLLSSEEYQKSPKPLLFALGKDVTGKPVYGDLARMPHLLIAGATGTGKSIGIHSILTGLLYRNPPEMLRFIMVDPKRVEMQHYSKIPHLLTPAITDPKKTIMSLRWAAKEMERRYGVLEASHVRDINSYHANILAKDEEAETMPYIVIVIDELADIMATYPRELEACIVRLAQMSRAVGIHLVLSTQRPSVEVITGLIKANITSRMAFQVASQIDSRTILDTSGADKLLGNGDMLFLSGEVSKPRRIQGAFVSEGEVKRVTKWLADHAEEMGEEGNIAGNIFENNGKTDSVSLVSALENGSFGDDADDELFEEAKKIAIEAGKVSASYLQRRLKVGYARAARLLDVMEARGIIGPSDGAKPREVLIGKDGDDFGKAPSAVKELGIPEAKEREEVFKEEERNEKEVAKRKNSSSGDDDFLGSFN